MLSDDELVEQILLGNENAAEELIKRYYTSILRYCRWHCSNLEKAEDLTQETFLKLFKNLFRYKGKKKFKAYLYTIANHLCVDESRKVEFSPLEDEENIVHEYNDIVRLEDTSNYKTMISYVDPDKLTGFYERRQQVLDEFLEVSGQVGAEKEFLHQIERKVEKPFHYEWVEGWSTLLGSTVADLGVVMALFLGIVLSSLFAGEWHDNTSALVLTTRNGWGKIALAKILTGLAFTVELFALLAVSSVISQLLFMGTAGWDMPIQNIKLIAVAPMNMLQAEIYEYVFVLLGAIGFAGIVMFISAAVKNNVLALLLSLAVVYGPMMIAEYLPYGMQKALDLIPMVGSSTDIFRTNTFRIWGKLIWSPYLLITIPVLIGILCMPFAIKSWSRRMKA